MHFYVDIMKALVPLVEAFRYIDDGINVWN